MTIVNNLLIVVERSYQEQRMVYCGGETVQLFCMWMFNLFVTKREETECCCPQSDFALQRTSIDLVWRFEENFFTFIPELHQFFPLSTQLEKTKCTKHWHKVKTHCTRVAQGHATNDNYSNTQQTLNRRADDERQAVDSNERSPPEVDVSDVIRIDIVDRKHSEELRHKQHWSNGIVKRARQRLRIHFNTMNSNKGKEFCDLRETLFRL